MNPAAKEPANKEFTPARLNYPDTSADTAHGVPVTVPVTRPASVARYPRQDPRYVPDRVMQHAGLTHLSVQGNIHIHYDAQLRDVLCCTRLQLCFECREINMQRSYLYLRENSIESNIATKCCCCSCWDRDSIVVNYFDRKPFRKESVCFRGSLCDVPCCCCLNADPKLEVRKGGCMICCMHVQENECCCLKDEVVVTPSQDLPLPCCCFANRHGWCTNFCGCCGQPDGK